MTFNNIMMAERKNLTKKNYVLIDSSDVSHAANKTSHDIQTSQLTNFSPRLPALRVTLTRKIWKPNALVCDQFHGSIEHSEKPRAGRGMSWEMFSIFAAWWQIRVCSKRTCHPEHHLLWLTFSSEEMHNARHVMPQSKLRHPNPEWLRAYLDSTSLDFEGRFSPESLS